MTTRIVPRLAASVALLLGAAACARGDATANDDLARELESAAGETGLLPASGGTRVVSPIEQTAPRGDQPRPVARRVGASHASRDASAAPATAGQPEPPATAAPGVAAREPSPEPARSPATGTAAEAGAGAPRPLPLPAPNGRRRGGVWSTGDVIRNAPFPINP